MVQISIFRGLLTMLPCAGNVEVPGDIAEELLQAATKQRSHMQGRSKENIAKIELFPLDVLPQAMWRCRATSRRSCCRRRTSTCWRASSGCAKSPSRARCLSGRCPPRRRCGICYAFQCPHCADPARISCLKLSCSCGQPRRVRAICRVTVMSQLGVLLLGFAP